jgi:hypothetical protein
MQEEIGDWDMNERIISRAIVLAVIGMLTFLLIVLANPSIVSGWIHGLF